MQTVAEAVQGMQKFQMQLYSFYYRTFKKKICHNEEHNTEWYYYF